jgi:hypothetical protein
MRAYEILREVDKSAEEQFMPASQAGLVGKTVYHGTSTEKISKIMRHGLLPRPNKWIHNNRWHGAVTKFKPGERKEVAELSTTTQIDKAKQYAAQGGSTGWSTGNGGVIFQFEIVGDDIVSEIGYDENEVVFKNKISPERLKIVFPDRLVGKEKELLGKAGATKSNSLSKTAKIKKINQELKAAGSTSFIRSVSANTPRIKIIGPASHLLHSMNMGTPEFDSWIQRELKKPTTPEDVQQYYDKKRKESDARWARIQAEIQAEKNSRQTQT